MSKIVLYNEEASKKSNYFSIQSGLRPKIYQFIEDSSSLYLFQYFTPQYIETRAIFDDVLRYFEFKDTPLSGQTPIRQTLKS
jgi:hypothetical protein